MGKFVSPRREQSHSSFSLGKSIRYNKYILFCLYLATNRQYLHRLRAITQRRGHVKAVLSRIGAKTTTSYPSLRLSYPQAATRHICRSSQTSGHSLRFTPNRHAASLRPVHSARSDFSSANSEKTGRGLRTVFSIIGDFRSPISSCHSDLALTLYAQPPASIRLPK